METLIARLVELYVDLTESDYVFVDISQNQIMILIISDWFTGQTMNERLEYLIEGLQVGCPELIRHYNIHFLAYTSKETEFFKTKLAS